MLIILIDDTIPLDGNGPSSESWGGGPEKALAGPAGGLARRGSGWTVAAEGFEALMR